MIVSQLLAKELKRVCITSTKSMQGCQGVRELGQLDNHLNLSPSQQNQLRGHNIDSIGC